MAEPSADGRRPNWQYKAKPALEAFEEDRLARTSMIAGTTALKDALESGYGPNTLIWREFGGGAKGLGGAHRYPEVQARMEARNELADKLRVSRDPCPKCGTRRDVGCRHNRPMLGHGFNAGDVYA